MDNISEEHAFSTEDKILEAAKKVFIMHGLEGTSMQKIADEAQINKSLLHYYFRTKEKLFDAVFSFAFRYIVPEMQGIMNSDETVFIKIEKIIGGYMDLLMKNKFIPAFVLHEINRDPDRLFKIMKSSGVNPKIFTVQFLDEVKKGNIRSIDPRHLIVNILSMCIFPVAARPLMQRILFDNHEEAYQQFLAERKKVITDFVIQSIKL
jgi:TetR/AcrR family transcriptional regulator